MLLGAALVLVGGALLYYGFKGQDPRKLFATRPPAVPRPPAASPSSSLGAPGR